MSVYHTSFNYLDEQSYEDYGLVISHFADDADSGETETFMSMEPIYTDNAYGTKRIDYGAKYSSVAVFRITVMKQDGGAMSVADIRKYLKWLTGARTNSPLELLIGDEVKYSFIGRFTNAWHYKMDARTLGLILEFTSISPWAYSTVQKRVIEFIESAVITINNTSDDLYEYVYPKIKYENSHSAGRLEIRNETTGEETIITNLGVNETITIDNNFMITSDKPSKVFGADFNFVFPRFKPGLNKWVLVGSGTIEIEYVMYLKVGDCARDINSISDPICNEDGEIQIDMLDWSRISNTPTTISGYGLTSDIDRYYYNKKQVDTMFDSTDAQIRSTASLFNTVYTKREVDQKNALINSELNQIGGAINSVREYISSVEKDIPNDYYAKPYIDDNFYTKKDINDIVEELNRDASSGEVDLVSWVEVTGKPTTLAGYQIKNEVVGLINSSINSLEIDENELNQMLVEVFG